MSKKKPAPRSSKSFEESLWETATKLHGSMSINTTSEDAIRQKLIENDLVDVAP